MLYYRNCPCSVADITNNLFLLLILNAETLTGVHLPLMTRCSKVLDELLSDTLLVMKRKIFYFFSRISMETAAMGGMAGFHYVTPNHIVKTPMH